MNPEDAAIRNLDSRKRIDDIEEVARKLLLPRTTEQVGQILRELAFMPESFIDLYTEEGVKRDIVYVRNMHEKFSQNESVFVTKDLTEGDIKRLSERVEFEVIRGINAGHWFEGLGAHKTSEYDDIYNGVDIVLEVLRGDGYRHLGLGVDITFSQNIIPKFQRIKNEIDAFDGDKNRLARVKYFDSPNTGVRGELNSLARAVVAVDLPMLQDMARLKDEESLHNHISKHVTIMEIKEQLQVFVTYAESNNPAAAKPIQRALNFINEIAEELNSEKKVAQSEYLKNRKANDAISTGLSLFN